MTPEEMARLEEFDGILAESGQLSADELQELLRLIELAEIVELGEAIAAAAVDKRTAMR